MSETPKNPLPCGCAIMGIPEINMEGTEMRYIKNRIEFCPLHTAAPDLLEACKEVIKAWEMAFDKEEIAQIGLTLSAIVQKAIAKAEGK